LFRMLRFVPHSVFMRQKGFVRDPKAPFMTDAWVRAGHTQADLAKVAHAKRVVHRSKMKADRALGLLSRFVNSWAMMSRVTRNSYLRREPKGMVGFEDSWGDLAIRMDKRLESKVSSPAPLWHGVVLEKLGPVVPDPKLEAIERAYLESQAKMVVEVPEPRLAAPRYLPPPRNYRPRQPPRPMPRHVPRQAPRQAPRRAPVQAPPPPPPVRGFAMLSLSDSE
jgi:hypothetical protein